MMERWDNQKETGIESPANLKIWEGNVPLLEVTGETPEHAICVALLLLESAHERTGRDDPMARAVAKAAEIMNDGVITEGNIPTSTEEI